jgi:hypothetical protein
MPKNRWKSSEAAAATSKVSSLKYSADKAVEALIWLSMLHKNRAHCWSCSSAAVAETEAEIAELPLLKRRQFAEGRRRNTIPGVLPRCQNFAAAEAAHMVLSLS